MGYVALVAELACAGAGAGLPGDLPLITPPPADPDAECRRLGSAVGTADPFFGGLKSDDELIAMARRDALTRAQSMGATHVRFGAPPRRWASGMFGGGQGVTVVGVAFSCAAKPAASPTPPTGCTKDTDCKVDRICQAGVCSDPMHAPEPAHAP